LNNYEFFNKELQTITDDDIREFTIVLLSNASQKFYEESASSTGKYHPAYTCCQKGLCMHCKGMMRFLNHILTIEQHKNGFTSRQQNLMRCAVLYHDGEKYGKEGESKYTVFNHPLLAASTVRNYKGQYLNEKELEFIASLIETHMGEFNTDKRSKIELPKPKTAAQKLIHLADYLSSRKDIEILFDNDESVKPSEPPTLENYKLTFGKHKGELLMNCSKDYQEWLYNSDLDKIDANTRKTVKEFLKEILKEVN
jgi:exopolyphosphatase/pppGpp-phosphohydrolase